MLTILTAVVLFTTEVQAQVCDRIYIGKSAQAAARIQPSSHLAGNNFNIMRPLWAYDAMLSQRPGDLLRLLKGQKTGSVFMDFGAGLAMALRDTLKDPAYAHLGERVAIGYHKPFGPELNQDIVKYRDHFKYVDGGYLEVLFNRGDLDRWRGQVSVLTDNYGVLSYCTDLNLQMRIAHQMLKEDGDFMFNLEIDRFKIENGSRSDEIEKSHQFLDQNGRAMDTVQAMKLWLNQLQGFQVLGTRIEKSEVSQRLVVHLRKSSNQFSAPELKIVSYKDGKPPVRIFQFESDRVSFVSNNRDIELRLWNGKDLLAALKVYLDPHVAAKNTAETSGERFARRALESSPMSLQAGHYFYQFGIYQRDSQGQLFGAAQIGFLDAHLSKAVIRFDLLPEFANKVGSNEVIQMLSQLANELGARQVILDDQGS